MILEMIEWNYISKQHILAFQKLELELFSIFSLQLQTIVE